MISKEIDTSTGGWDNCSIVIEDDLADTAAGEPGISIMSKNDGSGHWAALPLDKVLELVRELLNMHAMIKDRLDRSTQE